MNTNSLDQAYFQDALIRLHETSAFDFQLDTIAKALEVDAMLLPTDGNGKYMHIEATACDRLVQVASQIATMQTEHRAVDKFKKIMSVFEQIRTSSFETQPMFASFAWQLAAYFCRLQTSQMRPTYMEVKHSSVGFARVHQWEPQSKLFTIVACKKFGRICAQGTFKEVYSSLSFHIDTAERIDTVFMLSKRGKKADDKPCENIALTVNEFALYAHIDNALVKKEDSPVVAPIACGSWRNGAGEIIQVSAVFPAFEQSLSTVAAHKDAFSIGQKLYMAKDLGRYLIDLHLMQLLHGDVKPENALYKLLSADSATAKWTDLGLSFINGKEPSFTFKSGSYGSIVQTAPEFFGLENQNLSWEEYVKLESWAYGCMLYSLFIENELPWQKHILDYFRERKYQAFNAEVLVKYRTQVEQKLAIFVEEALERAEPLADKSKQLQINCVIWKMLRIDPTQRITLEKALPEIQKIIDTHEPPAADLSVQPLS